MDGSPRASVFAYKDELDHWLEELLHEKEIASKKSAFLFKNKLVITLSLAILVISIMAVIAWKILSPKPGVSSLSHNPSLAILYFRNNTGDESLDYLRKAICDLLISDLSQSRYLNVLPEDTLFHNLRNLRLLDAEYYDTKGLDRFAEYSQVDNVVFGNIIKSGNKFRFNTTLRKIASDENITIESVDSVSEAELFSVVDEISKRIKAELVVPPDMVVGESDKEMESITTSSIEALRYYIEGRQLYRKGQAKESIPFFEKAIDLDPEFAMAYRMLAMGYGALSGFEDRAKSYMKNAFELRHHVSEREGLLIQGHYYRRQGEAAWDKAIETFEEFLRIYPDDYKAIVNLGSLYRHTENWDKAIEILERITHIYYFSSHFAHLRRAFCARGDYADALNLTKRIPVDLYPYQYPYQLTLDLFLHGKLDLALHEAEKILDRSEDWYPVLRLKGDIHLIKDDLVLAEECYKKCLDPKGLDTNRLRYHNLALTRLASLNLSTGKFDRAMSYVRQGIDEMSKLGEKRWLRYFYMSSAYNNYKKGNIDEAAEECRMAIDSALENASVRGRIAALQLKGFIDLEINNWSAAQIAADEIKRLVDNWLNPKLMRYFYRLRGHIYLEQNNNEEAISDFEKAISFLPFQHDPEGDEHAPFYDSLALAFYRNKDYENAQKWYEKILDLTSGRIYYGDICAKSFYVLGKIYEQKGWKGKAIESYQKFLDLWKDADSVIPEIEDARVRLIAIVD
jgi:tetratricopeptide (TPR) repeat protein